MLVTWKPDADPTAIDEFLAVVPDLLAQGPFASVEHGPTRSPADVRGKPSSSGIMRSDWGLFIEITDADTSTRWETSEPHRQLQQMLRALAGSMTVLLW